jgi:alkylation response protein AidB-like acyl-CoA dehydrogenase
MTDFAPSIEAFTRRVEVFLSDNALRKNADERFAWGSGDDHVGVFSDVDPATDAARLAAARAWQALKYDAGLAWITGPPEYGGLGLSPAHEEAYRDCEERYEVPDTAQLGAFVLVGPTILAHGVQALRDRWLRPLYRGDVLACQLFSEPSAGSDLAGLRTTAVRDRDAWIVNGQKVWNSGADRADIGELLCRTDPSLPKHAGISAFIVDMRTPGIDVRPIRQMTGGAHFCEVFLTDVRVPDANRLGAVHGGWSVAITTLMAERAYAGDYWKDIERATAPDRLADLLRNLGRDSDAALRDRWTELCIRYFILGWHGEESRAAVAAGGEPGPELSMRKLVLSENLSRAAEFAAEVLGPRIVADTGEWGTFAWSQFLLEAPSLHIGGGTDEILKNILAERVLRLPKG